MAPFLLLICAFLVEYSIYFLIEAALLTSTKQEQSRRDNDEDDDNENGHEEDDVMNDFSLDDTERLRFVTNHRNKKNLKVSMLKFRKGSTSYESVACEAFGPKAKYFAMGLVFTICFFTVIGYGVLLRDMLLPLSDTIFPQKDTHGDKNNHDDGPTLGHNAVLLIVIFLVTPLCTLRNLTALESVGAASMLSIFVLFICISYRSIECNFSSKYDDVRKMPWHEYIHYLPQSSPEGGEDEGEEITGWDNVLNALPILISVFMCHFNVLPVHNELKDPTPKRVNTLFRTTIWGAFVFYALMGFIGSMYGNCTPNGVVESNVLLSFDESDILLLIGRFCLSLTITFAFPILVVPARDTALRGLHEFMEWRNKDSEESSTVNGGASGDYRLADNNDLSEPFLSDSSQDHESDDVFYDSNLFDDVEGDINHGMDEEMEERSQQLEPATKKEEENANERRDNRQRIIASVTIFWIGAIIACSVKDIDIIWDILGGSLSLIMGFTMPSATYLVLSNYIKKRPSRYTTGGGIDSSKPSEWRETFDKVMSCTLFILFIPLMFMLTGNAIYNITSSN